MHHKIKRWAFLEPIFPGDAQKGGGGEVVSDLFPKENVVSFPAQLTPQNVSCRELLKDFRQKREIIKARL